MYDICSDVNKILVVLFSRPSAPGAVSSYECSSLSSITIEGPLRRKTLMKEGKKPTVSLISHVPNSVRFYTKHSIQTCTV